MINSFPSSQNLPKILILHGLNNNDFAFQEFEKALKELGFETERLVLPGHGNDRYGPMTFSVSETHNFVLIAYSTGALYVEEWLQTTSHLPRAIIYLAPAFFIKNEGLLTFIADTLPENFKIPSFAPLEIRLYSHLYIKEYRSFFNKVKKVQKIRGEFPVKTMVVIDEKDELVNASKLIPYAKSRGADIKIIKREGLKGPGAHHILFASQYWKQTEWEKFIRSLASFAES